MNFVKTVPTYNNNESIFLLQEIIMVTHKYRKLTVVAFANSFQFREYTELYFNKIKIYNCC